MVIIIYGKLDIKELEMKLYIYVKGNVSLRFVLECSLRKQYKSFTFDLCNVFTLKT